MDSGEPQSPSSLFSEETEYNRDLGLVEAVSIVIGRIIGSGIFRTPGAIMALVLGTGVFGLAWVLGGIVTIFAAVCYAELVAMMPKSGGPYYYLKAAYGPLWAFLRGWAMFFVSETASIVAVALVFSEYGHALYRAVTGISIPVLVTLQVPFFTGPVALPVTVEIIAAFCIIWVLTVINFFGVFISGVFQNIFSTIKVVAVGLIIGSCVSGSGSLSHFASPLWPDSFSAGNMVRFCAALRLVFFTFSGWEGATYIAEEVKNPRRNLPLSLFLGIGGVMVLYLGVNIGYIFQLPVDAMMASKSVAADAVQLALGSIGGVLISGAIMVITFGNVSTQILVKARSWQVMARDGLFFGPFRELHPKYRTPNNALVAQALWATVLLGFSATAKDSYVKLIDFFFATGTIFNIMTFCSVFVLRRKYPDAPRPYRAWLYPFSLIVIVLIYAALLVVTLKDAFIPSIAGLGLTSTGVLYYYWKIKSR